MRYRARIPEGIKPGQIIPVKVSGVIVSVRLPKGKVGDAFIFEVNRDAWEAARSNPMSMEEEAVQQSVLLEADLIRRRRPVLQRVANIVCSCSWMSLDKDRNGPLSDLVIAV
ncbi:hypothetical protein ACA910_017150 [Epithemia clementina (nom. ined.)]